jgi:hypothetical protein
MEGVYSTSFHISYLQTVRLTTRCSKHILFISQGVSVVNWYSDGLWCLHLQGQALSSVTIYQATQQNVQEDLKLKERQCENLNNRDSFLVIGPSILVYILIETQQMHQMTTLLWCPVRCSYMFQRTNAIIREFIWSSQATYMSVCITRRIMEFQTIWLQSVLLHYGYEWLWLTAVGSSGLLWNMAQGVQGVQFVLLLFLFFLFK